MENPPFNNLTLQFFLDLLNSSELHLHHTHSALLQSPTPRITPWTFSRLFYNRNHCFKHATTPFYLSSLLTHSPQIFRPYWDLSSSEPFTLSHLCSLSALPSLSSPTPVVHCLHDTLQNSPNPPVFTSSQYTWNKIHMKRKYAEKKF